jgi:hypothetical protein
MLELATPDVAERIIGLKDTDINKTMMIELFSQKPQIDKSGKIVGIIRPYVYTDTMIDVHAGIIPNLHRDMRTTVGRFIFNMYCLASVFGSSIHYINKTLPKDGVAEIQQTVVDLLLAGKLKQEQFAKFQNRVVWLNNFTELFVPGMSPNLLRPLPAVQKRKAELIAQYHDAIVSGDHVTVVDKIEKELLALAKSELKNDPSYQIYELGGKPSFGNNYKNTQVMVGPIKDPITDQYQISTSSLSEGIPVDEFHTYANTLVMASYSRGVSTQDGGAKTKYLFAAMQSVVLDEPDSDCGTTLSIQIIIDQKNYRSFLYQYTVEPDGALTLLTLDNIRTYMGRVINVRSPMTCRSRKICNKCAGELFYKIGIKNIGLTVTKITSTLLNLALKQMHDTSMKVTHIDPFKYMTIEK